MEKVGTKITMKGVTKKEHENNRQKERNSGKWGEKERRKKRGKREKRRKMYKECSSTFASLRGPPILDCSLDLL